MSRQKTRASKAAAEAMRMTKAYKRKHGPAGLGKLMQRKGKFG